MRRCVLILALLLGLGRQPAASQTLIEGGWLFDGGGDSAIVNPGLLIQRGRIVSVGGNAAEPGTDTISLRDDEYILPGFFDLHAHHAIDLFGRGRVDETRWYPLIFLGNGVTSVFSGGEVDPDSMDALRRRLATWGQVGPRLYTSGPYFGSWREGWSDDITADSIHAEVDYWYHRGVRHFKAKGIGPEHLAALIERAHAHGATVTGHLDSGFRGSVNPRDAVRMGIDRVEHFLGGDALDPKRPAYASLEVMEPGTPEFEAIARAFIEANVYFDATLTAYGYFGERDPEVFTYWIDEREYFTPFARAQRTEREPIAQFERIYRVKRRLLKAFYDAGGGELITIGTDHPSWGEFVSGHGVHREMHAMVLAGIPAPDVLRIATINGARALGVGDRLGTVEVGKWADLAVVRGDPVQDIRNTRNVTRVMRGGQIFDASTLRELAKGRIGPEGPDEIAAWTRGRRQ